MKRQRTPRKKKKTTISCDTTNAKNLYNADDSSDEDSGEAFADISTTNAKRKITRRKILNEMKETIARVNHKAIPKKWADRKEMRENVRSFEEEVK